MSLDEFISQPAEQFSVPAPEDGESDRRRITPSWHGASISANDPQNPKEAKGKINRTSIDDLARLGVRPVEITGFQLISGDDTREYVRQPRSYPWRCIGKLIVRWPNTLVTGATGSLIGLSQVITAAHTVYRKSRGGWATAAMFIPAYDGSAANESQPYGTSEVSEFHATKGWVENDNVGHDIEKYEYDLAVLSLRQAPNSHAVGEATGYLSIGDYPTSDLVNRRINVAGYPTENLPAVSIAANHPGQVMFHGAGAVLESRLTTFSHVIDTTAGQSGSPVWVVDGNFAVLVGIHSSGIESLENNQAVRINSERFDRISRLIDFS